MNLNRFRPAFRLITAVALVAATAGVIAGCGSGTGIPNQALQALIANGQFSLVLSSGPSTVAAGGTAVFNFTANSANGFNSPVTLSSTGLPSGASIVFSPNPVTPSAPYGTQFTGTLTAPSAAGPITFNVVGTSGQQSESIPVSVTVTPVQSGTFTVAVTPSSRSVLPGGTTSYTVTITPQNGFTGSVALSLSGLPQPIQASFATSPVVITGGIGTATLNVTSTNGVNPPQTYNFTVTGTSGQLTASGGAQLNVDVDD